MSKFGWEYFKIIRGRPVCYHSDQVSPYVVGVVECMYLRHMVSGQSYQNILVLYVQLHDGGGGNFLLMMLFLNDQAKNRVGYLFFFKYNIQN